MMKGSIFLLLLALFHLIDGEVIQGVVQLNTATFNKVCLSSCPWLTSIGCRTSFMM